LFNNLGKKIETNFERGGTHKFDLIKSTKNSGGLSGSHIFAGKRDFEREESEVCSKNKN